jgi:hypothetical protein
LPPAFTLVSSSAYFSILKMEAICSSGTSVDFKRPTRLYFVSCTFRSCFLLCLTISMTNYCDLYKYRPRDLDGLVYTSKNCRENTDFEIVVGLHFFSPLSTIRYFSEFRLPLCICASRAQERLGEV